MYNYSIREILLSTVKLGYNVTTKIVRYSRDNLGSKPLIWDQKSGHNLVFFKAANFIVAKFDCICNYHRATYINAYGFK